MLTKPKRTLASLATLNLTCFVGVIVGGLWYAYREEKVYYYEVYDPQDRAKNIHIRLDKHEHASFRRFSSVSKKKDRFAFGIGVLPHGGKNLSAGLK